MAAKKVQADKVATADSDKENTERSGDILGEGEDEDVIF